MRYRKQYKRGPNYAENELENILEAKGIYYTRRGYPDYTILDKNGEIYGFIEVKPYLNKQLKESQKRFMRFCERYKIPFRKWTPNEPYPF